MQAIDTLIFDLEGVLYKSDKAIDNAPKTINRLRNNGFKIGFFTNASVKTIIEHRKKLSEMDIINFPSEIETSNHATAQYFIDNSIKNKIILTIGEKALFKEFKDTNNHLVSSYDYKNTNEKIDFVVMGFYLNFNYKILTYAQQAILDGADFIVTDEDAIYPHKSGRFFPSIKWQVASVTETTGKKPTIIGKPNPYMINNLLKRLNSRNENTLIIGDNRWSDISSGINANCKTCLVKSGVSETLLNKISSKMEMPKPDLIIDNVTNLISILKNW